jgi:aminopeptidase-like protein/aminoglycoside N3'-acetyltransferase
MLSAVEKKEYHYDKEQLMAALRKVGLKKGDIVLSHSNVGFLGYPKEGHSQQEVFQTVLDAFSEVLGAQGTLVVPAFSYSFCNGEAFDLENSPSQAGAFSEFVRRDKRAMRSADPIFSVCAIGPKAKELTANLNKECFGKDSVWDRLMRLDAVVLNIGIEVGSTFIHYVERRLNVPYRYNKLFSGDIIEGDRRRKDAVIYFVKDLSYPAARANWSNLNRDARNDPAVKFEKVGRGEISLIRCRRMFELCRRGLKKNPAYLVEGLSIYRPDNRAAEKEAAKLGMKEDTGAFEIIEKLWKLPRDIISDGYDTALAALAKIMPLKVHGYPTGSECWTWIIPEKWSCQEACLETAQGKKIFSYADNPLHAVSYSLPFEGIVGREELLRHLYTHPKNPKAVPFKFKYYEQGWGLCCSQETKDALNDAEYKVKIKTTFSFGELKVGEIVIPGKSRDSIVLCAHLCHPAAANDGLSGVAVGIELMRCLRKREKPRYTYRFLILPETIGSAAWLSHNERLIPKLKGGIFLEMLGTDLPAALQLSLAGDTQIDKCCASALKEAGEAAWVGDYSTVIRNDERNFNAPGVRVPMLSLSRVYRPDDARWPYPEYHSHLDNIGIISARRLEESVRLVLAMLDNIENNYYVVNKFKGRVFCSRYGIYIDHQVNPAGNKKFFQVMDLIDGTRSVADIAQQCGLSFGECLDVLGILKRHNLIEYTSRKR